MVDPKVEEGINEQINAELYSAYIYYSMAQYFDALSLKGFSHWLRVQALEEMTHVQRFSSYLNDRRGRVVLRPIEPPPSEWESPLAVFEEVYAHEVRVTALITADGSRVARATTRARISCVVREGQGREASADEVVQKPAVDKARALFLPIRRWTRGPARWSWSECSEAGLSGRFQG
jgi:ferritin